MFNHNGSDQISHATKDVVQENIKDALHIATVREQQAQVTEYVRLRFIGNDVGFHDTLKQSDSPTLKAKYNVEHKKDRKELKANSSLPMSSQSQRLRAKS